MIEGVDYSDARPSPTGLVAVGKQFAGRYVGAGSGQKLLQADEARALSDAGLKIVSLVEGASDGALGGRAMGVQHAEQFRQWHADRGFPWPVPGYFAVDFDVQAAQWPAVRDYFQGVASTIGLPYTGIYGGLNAMRWAQSDDIARWFFQTYAWSAGTWDGGLHIEQYHNDVGLVGGQVDLDRALTPDYGGWTMTTNPPPPPATTDSQKLDWLVWSVGRGAPHQPPDQGNEAMTYWAGHVTDRLVALQAAVDALSTKETTPPAPCDLTPVLDAIAALNTQVQQIEPATTVDAVAIGRAMVADPAFVTALAAAVAGQLSAIQASITLSGTMAGGITPPKV